MMEIRKSLDNDFIITYNKLAEKSDISDSAIDDLRNGIGMVKNYFPHHLFDEIKKIRQK